MTCEARDHITILTSKGPLATKRITAVQGGPPKIEPYGRAQRFRFDEWPVANFDELAAALKALQHRERSFLVRGKPAGGLASWKNQPHRIYPRGTEPATLVAQPRHWLPFDFDLAECPAGIDPIWEPDQVVEHVVELLPEEFHGCSIFWAFTSSHGIKPGIRIRLWYWLDRLLHDWQIKLWLAPQIAGKVVDGALYSPAQAIYTATPIFVGMPDPVPYRCGTWTGYSDAVTPPVVERSQRSYSTGSANSGTSRGDGGGYEAYREQFGDGEGRDGFNGPIGSAIAAYIRTTGAGADTAWLRADLELAIREAPRDRALHPDEYVEIRVADLDSRIEWTLVRQGAEAEEDAAAAEAPIEPTYPAPLGSLDAARSALAEAMDRFADVALAWQPSGSDDADVWARADLYPPDVPPPPVHAVNADIGTGKTSRRKAARFG